MKQAFVEFGNYGSLHPWGECSTHPWTFGSDLLTKSCVHPGGCNKKTNTLLSVRHSVCSIFLLRSISTWNQNEVMSAKQTTSLLDVIFTASSFWHNEGYLHFSSLCKLGFSCKCLQSEFQKTEMASIEVPNRFIIFSKRKRGILETFTLPTHVRSATPCFCDPFWKRTPCLRWWLRALFSNEAFETCTFLLWIMTCEYWSYFCRTLHRHIAASSELPVPLHVSVAGFRRHRRSPCRLPHELPWVAERAHLLFHASSRITVNTPNLNITGPWVLQQLLGDEDTPHFDLQWNNGCCERVVTWGAMAADTWSLGDDAKR